MRPIVFAIVLFFVLDTALFRSGLYPAILTSESTQGFAHALVSALEVIPADPEKDILVLGDSRITEGFDAAKANAQFNRSGLHFIQAGVSGSSLRAWCYFLELLDPQARRYRAVVLALNGFRKSPLQLGDYSDDRLKDFDILAPLISTSAMVDLIGHQTSFSNKLIGWSRLFVTAQNYRDDFNDLLLRPMKRLENYGFRQQVGYRFGYEYEGRPENMIGLAWDAKSQTMRYPDWLSDAQKIDVDSEFQKLRWDEVDAVDAYTSYWIKRIADRYESSSSYLILVRMPKTPLPTAIDESRLPFYRFVSEIQGHSRTITFPEYSFTDLERPEYFFDKNHLNTDGRIKMTERLSKMIEDAVASDSSRLATGKHAAD